MNVASKELCEELYKLSGGWNDMDAASEYSVNGAFLYRRYTLGYLLRKLPSAIRGYNLILQTDGFTGPYWCAYYDGTPVVYKTDYSDKNPEDAACKLSIELFKRGILKGEN